MRKLLRVGMVFLKNSKALTFSAFLSIFFACFLSVSMFQLSTSAEISYKNDMLEEYGDYQIGISKKGGEAFTEDEIQSIENKNDVTKVSAGYYTSLPNEIYAVGVVDDEVNQSRYKYTYPVKGNEIVINTFLGKQYEVKEGETLSLSGREYIVKEILMGDSFTQNKMPMLVMDMAELHELLGNEDTGLVNYFLLQCKEDADMETMADDIEQFHDVFLVSRVGEEVKMTLVIFKGMLRVLFVIVILISGMFVVSIFHEYMRKYRKDLAVMRTIGGRRGQIGFVFLSMSLTISLCGCVAGALACVLSNDFLLNGLNQKIGLFSGNVIINWSMLLQMTITVFVSFNAIVTLFFLVGQNVLPIQVFQNTSTSLRRNKKGNRFLGLRKWIGMEGYLGIKLLMPKFWQNLMIILIIALITAFSYVGQSSLKLLSENNFNYYTIRMNGSDAYGEIFSQSELIPDDINKIAETFRDNSLQCCTLLGSFGCWNVSDAYKKGENKFYDLYTTDLIDFMSQFAGMRIKDWSDIPVEQRLVITEELAEYSGYQLGDAITLDTEFLDTAWIEEKKDFTIVEIVKWDNVHSVIMDQKNLLNYTEEKAKQYQSPYMAHFYINGKDEVVEEVCKQVEQEVGEFKWLIYNQVLEESDAIQRQRYAMIKIVMLVLILVAGIGWLNSAKGVLVAMREEYRVLRILGSTNAKVKRICWVQVWSYMLAGILLGIVMGVVIVYFFWRNNLVIYSRLRIYWENVFGIVVYLVGLSLFLYPTINKVSMKNEKLN